MSAAGWVVKQATSAAWKLWSSGTIRKFCPTNHGAVYYNLLLAEFDNGHR
jgi:hypothetical protein